MATYKVEMSGRSAITVLTKLRQDTYKFLQERNLEMGDYVTDWDNEMQMPEHMKPFPPDTWWRLDEGYHDDGAEGILFDSSNDIAVKDEDFNTVWKSNLNIKDLKNKINKVEIESKSKVDDFSFGSIVFVGTVYEGSTYSYEIETDEDFDPKNLLIQYSDINGIKVITSIDYEGGVIDKYESDTSNKGTDLTIEISKGKKSELPHKHNLSELTPWFDKKIKPMRDGFYEVKKCDEEIGSVLLKWNKNKFYRQKEERKYDKSWKIISKKLVHVDVPFHDIVCWRGLSISS